MNDTLKADNNTISERLRNAEREVKAIDPVSQLIGNDDIEMAYSIQDMNTEYRINQGARIVGKKIGLTSTAVQEQLGVDQPDFGILFDDMLITNNGSIERHRMLRPKAEGEIAFMLKKDLTKNKHDWSDILEATDYITAAIEIVDSRIRDWKIKITDTIADNASAAYYVISEMKRSVHGFDLENCEKTLTLNGETASTGKGSGCMDNPLNAMVWLADKMVELKKPLRAGEIILSGALGKFVDIESGDIVRLDIEGLDPVEISIL
ncbi:MAG: 2-keto-4-pentenoate hydratase [Saprospiraceae bacterium]|nr:2-keto-4-pentenoate hydratase [Saprospiraceae bacterium]